MNVPNIENYLSYTAGQWEMVNHIFILGWGPWQQACSIS